MGTLLRPRGRDDRADLRVRLHCVWHPQHLAAGKSVAVPIGRRPGADDRVEQVLALLVIARARRRGLLDQHSRLWMRGDVDGRVEAGEPGDAPDELIACRGADRSRPGSGHPFGRPLVRGTLVVIAELGHADDRRVRIALADDPTV